LFLLSKHENNTIIGL